jgi:hypothetical protein
MEKRGSVLRGSRRLPMTTTITSPSLRMRIWPFNLRIGSITKLAALNLLVLSRRPPQSSLLTNLSSQFIPTILTPTLLMPLFKWQKRRLHCLTEKNKLLLNAPPIMEEPKSRPETTQRRKQLLRPLSILSLARTNQSQQT